MGYFRYARKVYIIIQGHAPGVDIQDLKAAVFVGYADLDLAVETPRSSQGRIEDIGDVGGTDNDDLTPGREPIQKGQKLGYDPLFDLFLSSHLLPFGGDSVNFV